MHGADRVVQARRGESREGERGTSASGEVRSLSFFDLFDRLRSFPGSCAVDTVVCYVPILLVLHSIDYASLGVLGADELGKALHGHGFGPLEGESEGTGPNEVGEGSHRSGGSAGGQEGQGGATNESGGETYPKVTV